MNPDCVDSLLENYENLYHHFLDTPYSQYFERLPESNAAPKRSTPRVQMMSLPIWFVFLAQNHTTPFERTAMPVRPRPVAPSE